MLKRFRIVRAGRLIQRGIHMSQIVWCDLVDVIVKPVGKQEIAMTAPVARGLLFGSLFGK